MGVGFLDQLTRLLRRFEGIESGLEDVALVVDEAASPGNAEGLVAEALDDGPNLPLKGLP